ncbi:multidrug effflux MFS transporter [Vibrio sp. AK197]
MSQVSSSSVPRSQFILLILLVLFSPLAIDIYLPALPQIAETFHVEHTLAQDTISLFLFAMGVGQLVAGPLADKHGRRTVALGGISLYFLSALLAWGAQNIEWMLVARLLQGLGACATSVAAFATVRDSFGPQKSGKMISYLNGAICFIPALAPILGSWLTQAFDWRANFSFMALYALVVGSALFCSLKETNPQPQQGKLFDVSRYWSVLKNPMFLFHAGLCMFAMAVILAYVTSAPIVLMGQMGVSMNGFALWFGINAVVNIIACLAAPKFMDRFGVHKTLVVGLACMLLAGILMIVVSSQLTPLTFMLPIFISSLSFAWILGAAAGKALAPFGDRAGTAAALLGLFQMSGAGLVVSLVQRLGLEPSMMISFHMLILTPAILILFSSVGRAWHKIEI